MKAEDSAVVVYPSNTPSFCAISACPESIYCSTSHRSYLAVARAARTISALATTRTGPFLNPLMLSHLV